MPQNKFKTNPKKTHLSAPLVLLGNSGKVQLKFEAKQLVKQAQKESKGWERFFAL